MTRTTTARSPHRRSFAVRYLTGDDLSGAGRRGDATWFRDDVTSVTLSRWASLAGWKRSAIRVAAPPVAAAAAVSVAADPALWGNHAGAAAVILGGRAAVAGGRAVRHHRFRSTYVRPLRRAIVSGPGGVPGVAVHISPDFPGLAARLARPMSPAETAVRTFIGTRIQPVLMWAPERGMRAYWWTHERSGPLRKPLDWFRIEHATAPARVEITIRGGFAGKDQRERIRQAVMAKLGTTDLVESWDQVGRVAVVTYTARERPPSSCSLADIAPYLARLAEWEFIAGLTTGGRPVIVSLDDDAPHIACSAGSGAGKSVLAKLLAAQVLARGGRVTILDRKGSHRWARDLAGVTYCTTAEAMHHELLRLSAQADERNAEAMRQPEGWDPGAREFVIFEEMNATVAQLRQWWEDNRPKGAPKQSPAITAFRNIMFMGRSAKTNLFGVAQLLTANTTGGPESRENFGVRFLARYTANAWKMLAPECPMPRKSRTRGRWQVVIAGEATELQVAFLGDDEARELSAAVPMSPVPGTARTLGEHTGTAPGGDELLTFSAGAERFCPGVNLDTLKRRRSRARARGEGPRPRRTDGRTELYDADELRAWLATESTGQESTHG
jgi:hypothetical protein